jgi:hypothetical protein
MPFSESHSKLSQEEIRKDLSQVFSLDQKQRKQVQEILEKYKGEGLLEKYEFAKVLKELKQKRVELGLSEIDIKNIEDNFFSEEK